MEHRPRLQTEGETMARITVIGGTGYAGKNIVAEAARRGHQVLSYSRSLPDAQVPAVEYRTGDVQDDAVLAAAVQSTDGSDVVISALSPRGALEEPGKLREIERKIAALAQAQGVRLGVVGGAGSLLVAEGGPKLFETEGFPEAVKPEATEMDGVLQDLSTTDDALDWFFVSPAGGFGPWAAGEFTGTYRVGGDVLLVDAEGNSNLSGPDLAHAILEEVEKPAHRRKRFTAAY